jgi:hypothetical protein
MHARIVRFTGVSKERIDAIRSEVESGGPPPGVEASSIQLYHDTEQETGVVVVTFDSAEKLRAADEIFNSMDPGDTPGSRSSVDRCELVSDQQV